MEVILLIGLQASGKSTFFRERFSSTHECISKDRFPNARSPQKRQMRLLAEALSAGRSVVLDNTNVSRADREPVISAARKSGATVIGYYFASSVQDCVTRNREREGASRVPEVGLYSMIKRLEHPSPEEGFDRLHFVRLAANGGFEVEAWKVPGP